MQTIFALATARGRSGVAVIRVSGPEAFAICRLLAGSVPPSGRNSLRTLRRSDCDILDQALVLAFEAPRSFTGEDCVEFQIHGSPAVIRAVEDVIAKSGQARHAEAGEFTKRALSNGRLDLPQVEALGNLIASETEAQRRLAMRGVGGELTVLIARLRSDLLRARALLEATIDFADEEVPVDVSPDVLRLVQALRHEIASQIKGSIAAERVRAGFEVALVGPPNAGKSTLLNRIAKREIAITSRHAGTTRDVLEVTLDLGGLPVTFLDTAGLRPTTDEIERIGVDRSIGRAKAADLRVVLRPVGDDWSLPEGLKADFEVWSKVDLHPEVEGVSGLTGRGIEAMLAAILGELEERTEGIREANNLRHRVALASADESLAEVSAMLTTDSADVEIMAEHMRVASDDLSSIVGAVDVESVLGAIFSEFCIGK